MSAGKDKTALGAEFTVDWKYNRETILKIILALFKGLYITAVKRTNQKSKENFPGFIQHIFQPGFIGL